MRSDDDVHALGVIGMYIARPSYSKALGLLAAATALHLAGGPSVLVVSALTAGAGSLGAMVGRHLDRRTKRPGIRSRSPTTPEPGG